MRHGFIKVAAVTPDIRVADTAYNTEQICRWIDETTENGAKIVVFPELCITGYTCGYSAAACEAGALPDRRAHERKRRADICGDAACG